MNNSKLRNICIIAHVDHGKTTLVDHLLRQAGTFSSHAHVGERVMDSMDLERERGITIRAKNAAIQHGENRINIVDTPGHSDFGGEVERILSMVDGSILLVDAAEGPLPQTRFVLQKSLQQGHKVILVVNKVDRPECEGGHRIKEVVNHTFDLFIDLGATEEQADFPIYYACARQGWCTSNFEDIPTLISGEKKGTLEPLFQSILKVIPPPKIEEKGGLQMIITNLGWSDYVGRLAIGRLVSGQAKTGAWIYRKGDKGLNEKFKITKLYSYQGLEQTDVDLIEAGDVAVIAGCDNFEIGDSLCDEAVPALPRIQVDPPNISMIFAVNTAPFSGKEGEAVQSRKLRERLLREIRHNVALKFVETELPDQFRVLGRGELQFAILIEQMRREGLEFMVGKPVVLTQIIDGVKHEPLEKLTLDLPQDYTGDVSKMFQERKGILVTFEPSGTGRARLEFQIPTRGLLGMRSRFLTSTRGEGIFTSRVIGTTPWKGEMLHRNSGAIISDSTGTATEYALLNLEDRGIMFIRPGTSVYEGMVIGEFNKENDLNVNPTKEKKLTNVRAASAEILVRLKGIRDMSLERCIEWLDEDEWIEITPKNIRMRKKILATNMRSVVRRKDEEE